MTSRPVDDVCCAIDFGTSNSAIALVEPAARRMRLVALEDAHVTMPTAVFHDVEDATRRYGRAAVAAYVEGREGRLMRSLKSILGSALVEETTQLGDGIAIRFIDVIAGFLKQLKTAAEREAGRPITRAVIGRPVYFVDDDPASDRRAEDALRGAAHAIGFDDVSFQFEPVAAALDYAQRLDRERLVLVVDIGGGTSDFTLIRLGRGGANAVLANHGVHQAGTDFDQRVELEAILPTLGFRARTPEGREVPHRVYFDLATWHLINGVYAPRRVAELKAMRWFYEHEMHHRRLMHVVHERLGHRLVARAEETKVALSDLDAVAIDLDDVEAGLVTTFDRAALAACLDKPLDEIVAAARETTRRGGADTSAVDALYFTGGSTALTMLATRLTDAFPRAEAVFGDRFASVATGLGLTAMDGTRKTA